MSAQEGDTVVQPDEVMEAVKRLIDDVDEARESDGFVREGPFGEPCFVVRRDLDHLDADAMNDRLHAWIQREVHPTGFEAVSAFVSFDHARPRAPHLDEDPDHQEEWKDIEAVFRFDIDEVQPVTEDVLRQWTALVPAFLRTVGRPGRPENFRDVWHGAAE